MTGRLFQLSTASIDRIGKSIVCERNLLISHNASSSIASQLQFCFEHLKIGMNVVSVNCRCLWMRVMARF